MDAVYSIPLNTEFRFVHEPLDASSAVHDRRFVGRDDELDELASRIVLSDGGAFLVTGYRGVGKSTFVNRVLQRVSRRLQQSKSGQPIELIDVQLNVPRQMSSVEIMFHVLRGLYRRLEDKDLLARLDGGLRKELELAFQRTSQVVAIKNATGIEGSAGVAIGASLPFDGGSSTTSLSTKRTRSEAREMTYLAYDDKAAEYDLIHIARGLSRGYVPKHSTWRTLVDRLFRRIAPERHILKVIFVFDELDKIEEAKDGVESGIDAVLANLKTLFTTSGICFIFVAGRGTHDRWLEDVGLGDSIYESVFSYARYLQPMWAHAGLLCDPFLDAGAFGSVTATELASTYASFKKFLAFNGRGIPRRILRKFNERVRWNGEAPVLAFTADDVRQFRFFADLQDLLDKAHTSLLGELQDDGVSGRSDRQRLALYYLVDWILLRGFDEFGLNDAVAASRRLSRLIAPVEQTAPQLVSPLLSLLVENGYLEFATRTQASPATIPPGVEQPAPPVRYRLTRKRLIEMGTLAGVIEKEAQIVATEERARKFGSRYEVRSVLAHGGMSTVYLAEDRASHSTVVIKELLSEATDDGNARERLRREAGILPRLVHENVVRMIDVSLDSAQAFIVLEYVEGIRLADLIGKPELTEPVAVRIARDIVRAVSWIHSQGVLWLDAKPSNVIVTPEGRSVLIDFGIASLVAQPDRQPGTVAATLAFSSPEQLRNEPLDQRSDIYSIGVMLYQMFTGRLPFQLDSSSVDTALKRLSETPVPPSKVGRVSRPVEDAVMGCLNPDPAQRFATAQALLDVLPEGASQGVIASAVAHVARPATTEPLAQEHDTVVGRVPVVAPGGRTPVEAPAPIPSPSPSENVANREAPQLLGDMMAVAAAGAVYLVFQSGEARAIHGTEARIGRTAESDIQVTDSKASRFHAVLRKSRDGWSVEDQNSRSGTLVNQTPVTAPRLLRDGDVITIGETRLTFTSARPAEVEHSVDGPRVRQRDLTELIDEVRRLAATGTLDGLLNGVLDAAIQLGQVERGFVKLANADNKLAFSAARSRGGIPLPGTSFSTSRRIPDTVFTSGRELIVSDLLDDKVRADHESTVELGIRQVLCLPIKTPRRSAPLGVVYLDSRERGASLPSDVLSRLQILVAAAADAIYTMSLQPADQERLQLEQEVRLAAEVQGALTQPLTNQRGEFYEVVVRLARRRMGGESVNIISLGDGSIGIVLLDAAGRGAPAALVAAFVNGIISASSHLGAPSILLDEINRAILSRLLESRFAVMFYGVLTPDGVFTYANAGHISPFLISRNRGIVTLDSVAGVPLGIEAAAYESGTINLAPNEILVAPTADIAETLSAGGDEFGLRRVHDIAQRLVNREPAAVAEAIVTEVQAFAGDVTSSLEGTVAALRYLGSAAAQLDRLELV